MAGQTDTSETTVDSTEMDQHFAELAELYKQKRIGLVNDYLKAMKDSTLIFTSQSNSDAIGNVGSVSKFEVNYSLNEYHEENPDKE